MRAKAFVARLRLSILGSLFVAAGNAIVYGISGFSYLHPSFAAVLLVSFLAPFALGLLLSFSALGQVVVFALGLTWFLDVVFIPGGAISSAIVFLLTAYIIHLVHFRKSDTIVPAATTVVAVATMLIIPQQAVRSADAAASAPDPAPMARAAALRPYVHIILDEMSPLTLSPEGASFEAQRSRMMEDYRKRGFTIFNDTRVPIDSTYHVISDILAPSGGGFDNFEVVGEEFTIETAENRIAEKLDRSGYAVSILQTSYLDLCPSAEWSCRTYQRTGLGTSLEAHATDVEQALEYVLIDLHHTLIHEDTLQASALYSLAGTAASALGLPVPMQRLYVARPTHVLDLMDDMRQSLSSIDYGQAYVAHLLLPHFPHILDGACRLKDAADMTVPEWITEMDGLEPGGAKMELGYWEQTMCTHDTLMSLIDALGSSPAGRDAIVLIHSDHGSRLYGKIAETGFEGATRKELDHALLTHFAVKGVDGRLADFERSVMLRDRVDVVVEEIGRQGDGPAVEGTVTSAVQ